MKKMDVPLLSFGLILLYITAPIIYSADLHFTTSAKADNTKATEVYSQKRQVYRFKLTKGAEVPVCGAYLERLNTTKYERPPFCDRPENNSSGNGFTPLHKVPMSATDVHSLYPIIWTFMSSANHKKIDWADVNFQQHLTESGQFKLSESDSKYLQMYLDRGEAKIWRYEPPIDIDNDGVPDNVEVWNGIALPTGVGGRQCGDDVSDIFQNGSVLRQPQLAFVVSENNDRLDVHNTKKIFAHPKGGYSIQLNGQWTVADKFRPIGSSIGIFEYQGTYYFDTFFDGWGDFQDERRIEGAQTKNKKIVNTLAVFLHKGGKTRQMCEYLMSESQQQNDYRH